MLQRVRDRNIRLVYLTIFVLGTAYGMSIAVIALHLDARGFAKSDIGNLAAFFASGIAAAAIPVGSLLRRVSAKTVLATSLLGYAACVGVFPMLHAYGAIAAARVLDGAFSVGIWVSCETILLQRAEDHHKAYVTSLYAMSMALGYVVGPLAATPLAHAESIEAVFFAAAALATTSGVLVLWRLDGDPPGAHGESAAADESGPPRESAFGLLRRIRTCCFATFAYGYFQASVVLFLPLYLIESKQVARESTILIPAFFAAGMLLFSNAAGRLGDRAGHLLVMRALAAVGIAMISSFVFLGSFPLMALAVFVAGATLASISPLSLALQGVIASKRDTSRANAAYNAVYAGGMLLGPPISSVVFRRFGGAMMLVHLAALWAAFLGFAFVFAADDPAHRPRGAARGHRAPASLADPEVGA